MQKSSGWLMFVLIILLILLIWGLIGSSEAEKIGTTCDFGVGKNSLTGETGTTFCWKWHRNTIGQIGDNLNDLFGK